MELKHSAIAGTLESSDAQVTVSPGNAGIELTLESTVINQYETQIRAVILNTLKRLDVENCIIKVVDHGAIDCTLEARVECAVYRSVDQGQNLPWR